MKESALTIRSLDPQQTDVADIIQRLDRCATIVTGNRRLARVLRQIFSQARISEKCQVWPAPDILPWNAWLQRVWQEMIISRNKSVRKLLLTSHQEYYVWQEVFSEHTGDFPLHAVNETVTRILEAWQLLHAWRIPRRAADFDYNENSRLFWQLASAFEAKCQKNDWISFAVIPEILSGCLHSDSVQLPDELVLTGFDELTPQQSFFLGALAQGGCSSQWLQLASQSGHVGKIICPDNRNEIWLAAHWIRRRLEKNPAASIALVVPELATQREMICRILDEVLIPQALQPEHHNLVRPYNLSLGKPLSRFPPVSLALDILGLSEPAIELPHISRLLRSFFIAGQGREASARALLDARLRESGEWHLSLQKLLAYASLKGQPCSCPLLARCLGDLMRSMHMRPAVADPRIWVQWFEQWLKVAGWPGDCTLSSEEYQGIQAWKSLLGEFAALDWVTRPISLNTALNQLKRMAASTIFQPESLAAPVQVLGLLETSGLQFDHIWITGLHDGVWPASPRPNPFIPLPLQRKIGTPHSSAKRELHIAESLLHRIIGSAGEVVLSYPQRKGDEILNSSPLIDTFPLLDEEMLAIDRRPVWRDDIYHSRQLITLSEDPIPQANVANITGGSRIFKLQAACPFLAFAELRLGARPLGRIQIGLNALVRGNLLHRVMEKIWADLESWETLVNLSHEQVSELVAESVNQAVHEIAPSYPYTFGKHLQSLECKRLHRLVLAWLELEKNRPPFRVVNREKEAELDLNGLCIRLRIDRVDELTDGSKLLIDYKTGSVKSDQWFGERPDDPQLPLYSLIFTEALAGIAFAQIRTGELGFKGVAREKAGIPGINSFEKLGQTHDCASWSEVLTDWRQTIDRLAQDFLSGKVEVDPKQYPLTCTYCALKPLCRVGELF